MASDTGTGLYTCQQRQFVAASSVEDNRRSDPSNAWAIGEIIERWILQMLGITHDDVNDKIMAAGDGEREGNFGQLHHPVEKAFDRRAA